MTFFNIGPKHITLNYIFPSLISRCCLVTIKYNVNVKALLSAIQEDLANIGCKVPSKSHIILKASNNVDARSSQRGSWSSRNAEGQVLDLWQDLSKVFDKIPNSRYIHIIVKPEPSFSPDGPGMVFIFIIFARIDLFICFH